MSLSIVATGSYCENVGDEQPCLKALVAESVGQKVRRIDRFIQLALIGAGRAARDLPSYSGVYYGSGCGDVQITVELLTAIYCKKQTPKPLSFVNSVSNAASFYVSRCLGLHGPSSFVTSRYAAMESALASAAMDIGRGRVNSALVGVVDIVLPPVREHHERLGLAADTVVAEASHWLQLCSNPGGRDVLAHLDAIRHFTDLESLLACLSQYSIDGGASLAFNQFIEPRDREQCLTALPLPQYQYHSDCGHFESRTGELLNSYLTADRCGDLLLVSGDPFGRYQLLALSRPQ